MFKTNVCFKQIVTEQMSGPQNQKKFQDQYTRKQRSGSTNDLDLHQAIKCLCIKIQMNEK